MAQRQAIWGLILRPTGAGGGYLAPHLRKIEAVLKAQMEIHANTDGLCQICLPAEYDARRAQELASELNELTDARGLPLLEVEITSQSPSILRGNPASYTP